MPRATSKRKPRKAPAGPVVSGLDASAVAALKRVPEGWWWSIGVCSVSCDASIGPDVNHCDKATLEAFDAGFHCDLAQPSTVAGAIIHVCEQAALARAAQSLTGE